MNINNSLIDKANSQTIKILAAEITNLRKQISKLKNNEHDDKYFNIEYYYYCTIDKEGKQTFYSKPYILTNMFTKPIYKIEDFNKTPAVNIDTGTNYIIINDEYIAVSINNTPRLLKYNKDTDTFTAPTISGRPINMVYFTNINRNKKVIYGYDTEGEPQTFVYNIQ